MYFMNNEQINTNKKQSFKEFFNIPSYWVISLITHRQKHRLGDNNTEVYTTNASGVLYHCKREKINQTRSSSKKLVAKRFSVICHSTQPLHIQKLNNIYQITYTFDKCNDMLTIHKEFNIGKVLVHQLYTTEL